MACLINTTGLHEYIVGFVLNRGRVDHMEGEILGKPHIHYYVQWTRLGVVGPVEAAQLVRPWPDLVLAMLATPK